MRVLLPVVVIAITICSAAASAAAQSPSGPRVVGEALRVEVHGSGPPVILIPGLMSGGDVWNGVVRRWSGSYELHVVTLAGFAGVPTAGAGAGADTGAGSDARAGDFLQRARDGIIAYIRENGLERPMVVGHSLGGFLALWIASTEPDLSGGVVAVDGVPYLVALGDTSATAASMTETAATVRQMYTTLTSEQMALQSRMSLSTMMRDTTEIARAVEWARESDPAAVGSAMAGMMTTDIRPDVHRISVPVLLLAAGGAASSSDQVERLRTVYSMQLRGVHDSRTVVAENALHFIMLDDPDFFHEIVDPFLASSFGVRTAGVR